jgi:hypothetical protein
MIVYKKDNETKKQEMLEKIHLEWCKFYEDEWSNIFGGAINTCIDQEETNIG